MEPVQRQLSVTRKGGILDQSSNTVQNVRKEGGGERERDCNSPPTTQGHFRREVEVGRQRQKNRKTDRLTD